MSPVKETNFFVNDVLRRNGIGDQNAIPTISLDTARDLLRESKSLHAGVVESLEVYMELFRFGAKHKARGEASPSYLYFSSTAVPKIHRLLPDCRIIILLRDPVERAWSNYKALIGREYLDPETAFLMGKERVAQGWEHFWDYLGLGNYTQQVTTVLDTFPRAQVGIWLYEDLMRDPAKYYREILRFIGVRDDILPDFSRVNASQKRLNRLKLFYARRKRLRKLIQMTVPRSVRVAIRRLSESMLPAKDLKLDPELRRWLLDYYREEIVRLDQLLPELNVKRWIEAQEKKLREASA